MNTPDSPNKSAAQIKADFASVFHDIVVQNTKKPDANARLKPYASEIRKLRRHGCTWKQIAGGMRDPRINQITSAQTLKALFGTSEEKAPKKSKKPQPPRLVLAPGTTVIAPAKP